MLSVAPRTARRIVRRGSRASSASGVAPSNPPNARIVKTDPAMTPVSPWYSPAGVCPVPKTDSVLWLPACTISSTARTRKTAISKMPRIVPRPAEVRMP